MTPMLYLVLLSLIIPATHGDTRERLANEIPPVSAEHSATQGDHEARFGAGLAIDLDMGTQSGTVRDSQGASWLKVNLDQVHCVDQVKWYYTTSTIITWTCSQSDCSCEGKYCGWSSVTVYSDGASLPPVSDCKFGDTVKFQFEASWMVGMHEIAITGKQIDGGYSDFGDWSGCSASCGDGTQTRTRTCTDPPPSPGGADCVGEASETRTCNENDCPVTCSKPEIVDALFTPNTDTISSEETYTVTCGDGFTISGPRTVTCQADGELSELPACKPDEDDSDNGEEGNEGDDENEGDNEDHHDYSHAIQHKISAVILASLLSTMILTM